MHGNYVWYELMTTDAKAAEAFYTKLFPWTPSPMQSAGGGSYTVFRRGEQGIGGVMQMTPEMGKMPAHWYPYFAVEDCDAVANKAKGMGAQLHMPPTATPDVGRLAVIGDPQGAVFAIIHPAQM